MAIGEVVTYRVDEKDAQFTDILLTNTDKKQNVEWHRFLRVGADAK
jgi:hypothetical protein